MTEAAASGMEALARFAPGLREERTALTAGLTLAWSNGPVAGPVNRLKLRKRQGYGRAGCALLRHRVLLPVVASPGGQAPTTPTMTRMSPRGQQGTDVGALLRAA
jgi:hypothetical protein